MKKSVLTCLLLLSLLPAVQAANVSVTIRTDEGFDNSHGIVQTMEQNLSRILSEINTAYDDGRRIVFTQLPMNEFTKKTLAALWDNVHFNIDDTEVVERCWTMKNGYMMRQIPLIMHPVNGTDGEGDYKEATVEFDKNGLITDFRFVFDSQLYESMERCGSVVELERELQILQYCDRFATAYSTKDMKYLQQVFSDDALIITGKVVQTRKSEIGGGSQKVIYNRQNKKQYLTNLAKAFKANEYIKVTFTKIGEGGRCGAVSRSAADPNCYGVRLHQAWRSSNYTDDGYLFLLWDFNDPNRPVIHVRTWQPEYMDKAKTQRFPEEEIFDLSDFDL